MDSDPNARISTRPLGDFSLLRDQFRDAQLRRLDSAADARAALIESCRHLAERAEAEARTRGSINLLGELAQAGTASELCDRIDTQIRTVDESLDHEHEVGVKLVSFGQSITFHIEQIGYHNPSLIIFHGITTEGAPIQLIQNITQVSFVLVKLPRPDPEQPKKPFGFRASVHDNTE